MTACKTYLNLSTERQSEIVQVALLEFTMNDYKNASLSSIIKKLDLAKGSFYRYFKSKKELYVFLIEMLTEIRFEEIDELSQQKQISLKHLIIENYRNKIQFDKKYPLYSGFSYRIFREWNNEELGEIITRLRDQVLQITRTILENFVNQGTISKSIDLDAAAFLIFQVQVGFFDYLSYKHNLDFLGNIEKGKPIYSMPDEEILDCLKNFVNIMVDGIQHKPDNK
ncbi:MAG: TetR/AcrR family transcriptional regulator [Bacteroidales bacterium]|nr:TetR/AcrR family transcriptional regulator [Bacteroidales bacterium]MBN2820576.1 TetR/AcrR family transcriptional regulator [Bacteroidales bacterium]